MKLTVTYILIGCQTLSVLETHDPDRILFVWFLGGCIFPCQRSNPSATGTRSMRGNGEYLEFGQVCLGGRDHCNPILV
jgi:hypothetical protein